MQSRRENRENTYVERVAKRRYRYKRKNHQMIKITAVLWESAEPFFRTFAWMSNYICEFRDTQVTKLRTSSARTSRLRPSTNHNFPSYNCSQGFRRAFIFRRTSRQNCCHYTVIITRHSNHICEMSLYGYPIASLITRTRERSCATNPGVEFFRKHQLRNLGTFFEDLCQKLCARAPWVTLNITELTLERNMGSILSNQRIVA
jgi:hypothetical protein